MWVTRDLAPRDGVTMVAQAHSLRLTIPLDLTSDFVTVLPARDARRQNESRRRFQDLTGLTPDQAGVPVEQTRPLTRQRPADWLLTSGPTGPGAAASVPTTPVDLEGARSSWTAAICYWHLRFSVCCTHHASTQLLLIFCLTLTQDLRLSDV